MNTASASLGTSVSSQSRFMQLGLAALLGIFVIVHRFLTEETDEAAREMFIDGVMWSGTLTLCETAVWGLLETFGKAPHLAMWAVPVVFLMQIGVTGPLSARTSR